MRDLPKYFSRYTDANNSFEEYVCAYRRKNILNIIERYKPESILEVGCGDESIANYIEIPVDILEPCQEFYNLARSRNNNRQAYFYLTKIEDHQSERRYDMVLLSSLLHEIGGSRDVLQKSVDYLKPKGIIHINVPNAHSLHRLIAFKAGIIGKLEELTQAQRDMQKNKIYDIARLKKTVEELGLKVEESGSYFIKPFTHEQMNKMISHKIIDDKVLRSLNEIIEYIPQYGAEIYVNAKY